jgi:hypothetical protein
MRIRRADLLHKEPSQPCTLEVVSRQRRCRGLNGLTQSLELERKRVPGEILYEADRLESLFFAGYDPHFEGDEPPGLWSELKIRLCLRISGGCALGRLIVLGTNMDDSPTNQELTTFCRKKQRAAGPSQIGKELRP